MINRYFQVTKPSITSSNLIPVVSGFILASRGNIDYSIFLYTLIGVLLVVSSGCVLNNYIDRDIDKKMNRTKNRIFANRLLSSKSGLIYAATLGTSGFALLYWKVNILAVLMSVIGFFVYVVMYSMLIKRKSMYSTFIGSVSGAMPPLIGYCAASNRLDSGALALLFLFSVWQIPHSYAIGILYLKDYQTASIPILPVKCGILITKHCITVHIVLFTVATTALTLMGYTGYKYLLITTLVNLYWLRIAFQGYQVSCEDKLWSRRLFIFSIIVINTLSTMISVDFISPSTNEFSRI